MKISKPFYIHLIAGSVYTAWISMGTWGDSGGDIAYWIFAAICLLIHLLVILVLKGRADGLKAWIIILALVITTKFILTQIYLNRDYQEGIQFDAK